jgi:hypothetical protein
MGFRVNPRLITKVPTPVAVSQIREIASPRTNRRSVRATATILLPTSDRYSVAPSNYFSSVINYWRKSSIEHELLATITFHCDFSLR